MYSNQSVFVAKHVNSVYWLLLYAKL